MSYLTSNYSTQFRNSLIPSHRDYSYHQDQNQDQKLTTITTTTTTAITGSQMIDMIGNMKILTNPNNIKKDSNDTIATSISTNGVDEFNIGNKYQLSSIIGKQEQFIQNTASTTTATVTNATNASSTIGTTTLSSLGYNYYPMTMTTTTTGGLTGIGTSNVTSHIITDPIYQKYGINYQDLNNQNLLLGQQQQSSAYPKQPDDRLSVMSGRKALIPDPSHLSTYITPLEIKKEPENPSGKYPVFFSQTAFNKPNDLNENTTLLEPKFLGKNPEIQGVQPNNNSIYQNNSFEVSTKLNANEKLNQYDELTFSNENFSKFGLKSIMGSELSAQSTRRLSASNQDQCDYNQDSVINQSSLLGNQKEDRNSVYGPKVVIANNFLDNNRIDSISGYTNYNFQSQETFGIIEGKISQNEVRFSQKKERNSIFLQQQESARKTGDFFNKNLQKMSVVSSQNENENEIGGYAKAHAQQKESNLQMNLLNGSHVDESSEVVNKLKEVVHESNTQDLPKQTIGNSLDNQQLFTNDLMVKDSQTMNSNTTINSKDDKANESKKATESMNLLENQQYQPKICDRSRVNRKIQMSHDIDISHERLIPNESTNNSLKDATLNLNLESEATPHHSTKSMNNIFKDLKNSFMTKCNSTSQSNISSPTMIYTNGKFTMTHQGTGNEFKRIKNINAVIATDLSENKPTNEVSNTALSLNPPANDLSRNDDSSRKNSRKFMEISNKSETPNRRASRSVNKNQLPPKNTSDGNYQHMLKLTQENVSTFQSLQKSVNTLQQSNSKGMLKEVGSLKSLGMNSPNGILTDTKRSNYDINTQSEFTRPKRGTSQSMMWDLTNSQMLKESMISANNGKAGAVDIKKVPVIDYCFAKHSGRNLRKY